MKFIIVFCILAFIFCPLNGFSDGNHNSIVIGTSAALSGHAGFLGRNLVTGLKTYFRYVNEHGGINGRLISLISYDDDYNPPLMISNVRHLIFRDKVLALIGLVGTPTTLTVLNIIQKNKIPLLFPFTGAEELRYPFKKWVFNLRPSYWDECAKAVEYLIKHGKKRIAVFYQKDAYGLNGLKGVDRALIKYNLRIVADTSYIRGTTNIVPQVEYISQFHPDAVVMVGTYDACAAFIKEAIKRGMRDVWFVNISFVGTYQLAKLLRNTDAHVLVTQVVPPPTAINLSAVKQYRQLLQKYYPSVSPCFVGLEGFLDAKLFVYAAKMAGNNLTPEGLIASLEHIKGLDLGTGEAVNFTPTNHQAWHKVYITQIKNGKVILIKD